MEKLLTDYSFEDPLHRTCRGAPISNIDEIMRSRGIVIEEEYKAVPRPRP
jgi:hypothetical protein